MSIARGVALAAARRVASASGVWAAPASQAQSQFSRAKSAVPAAASSESESEEPLILERTKVADVLQDKGAKDDGSWLWCSTEDSVFDAVKSMTSNNVGALLVLKGGSGSNLAGIITERDYLRKIIVQGRSSKTTKVGEIMTEENKLITVTPETKVLKAMELMTANRIRHIPVVENQKMKGMVSIGDVVRAVLSEHKEEVKRLNEYIKGSY